MQLPSCYLDGFFLFIVVVSSMGPTPRRSIPGVLRALVCDMPHLLAFVALNIVEIESHTTLEESSSGPHWRAAPSPSSVLICYVTVGTLSQLGIVSPIGNVALRVLVLGSK